MTPSILSLTFNDLTSLNRANPEINTSKSETDPRPLLLSKKGLTSEDMECYNTSIRLTGIKWDLNELSMHRKTQIEFQQQHS